MTNIAVWQKRLAEIYPNKDKTPDYIMAHIYTACSDLGHLLLRHQINRRCNRIVIKAIAWMTALSSKFDLDLEAAVAQRFPRVCPYCLKRPCECDRTGKRARGPNEYLDAYKIDEELRVQFDSIRNAGIEIGFTWFRDQIANIYPSNRALLLKGGQSYVIGKMLEEGGELHRAYSAHLMGEGDRSEIGAGLADLLAWVISCWDLAGEDRDLDTELAGTFMQGCYVCKKAPCECPSYSITLGQEEIIRAVIKHLRALKLGGVEVAKVDEAISAAEAARAMPAEKAKTTLLDHLKRAIGIAKTVDEGVETGEKLVGHFEEVINLVETTLS